MPGLLAEIVKGERAGVAGHVIACFDDTGLDAARVIARAPVVGIGEAACHLASLVAGRFADRHHAVAVDSRARAQSRPLRPCLALRPGARLRRARCSNWRSRIRTRARRIAAEIDAAIRDDRAEAIVLGCAGMADLAGDLSAEFGVPVIEGVSAAVKLIEALAALGIVTSKIGAFAPSPPKAYTGPFRALVEA